MREPELRELALQRHADARAARRARASSRRGCGRPRVAGQAWGWSRLAKTVCRRIAVIVLGARARWTLDRRTGRYARAEPHDASSPPPGASRELDLAAVGLDEPPHDREAEPGAAARRRAPEAVERARPLLRGHARALVAHAQLDPGLPAPHRHGDGARVRRDLEARSRAGCRAPARAARRRRARAHAVRRRRRARPRARRRARASASTRSRTSVAQRRRAPRDAPASARASASSPSTRPPSRSTSASAASSPAVGHVAREVLEPQAQRRQRRAQLVRRVGDELALRAEELLELRHRLVEDARRASAPPAGPSSLGRARVEVARADGRRRALEAPQRPRDEARERRRRRAPRRRARRRDRGEHRASSGGSARRPRRRVRDAHGAVDDAARGDRHGDVEEVRAERARVPRAGRRRCPRSAAAISGREAKLSAPATRGFVSTSALPRRSTITTRPPVSVRVAVRDAATRRELRACAGLRSASSASDASVVASCSTFASRSRRSRALVLDAERDLERGEHEERRAPR